MPEETARAIDHINIKILIAAIGVAAITASCAVIYFVYHTPSDVRAAYLTWRANVVVFFVGTGYSVFGWPKTEAITINREVGWDVSFSLASVAGDVAWVIGVCAAALLLTTILFVIVWRTQKQSGSEA
ncbi:MAG: hypothetical protein QNI90_14135 [Dinoroseobacter sp.]|nr:hypothetical protein [Dinoroseobacter sp.]